MSSKPFHHGNLRAALLELAGNELEAHGYEALSLRELAMTLGVSRAAPYRHFENKDALKLALADQGVEELRLHYEKAAELVAPAAHRLREACQAYLDFARQRPELYRLIFASDADWHARMPERTDGLAAFQIFEGLVADAMAIEAAIERHAAAMVCWCTIHGFAMLRLNRVLAAPADVDMIEQAVLAVACRKSV